MDPVKALLPFLDDAALRRTPRRLVVAVSGGADSVALLLAAAHAAPAMGWAVSALHCDHGLRGRASDLDARFVEKLCDKLGVPLQVFRIRLAKGPGVEARARAWRRRCYARAAVYDGAKLLLLAHHAQDQAETLLLNLVRGSGALGAAAMPALSPLEDAPGLRLGRPFLGLTPLQLRQWLQGQGQPWREDASNRDVELARNRLRHRVLPQLLAINPKAVEHLAAFSARLRPAKGNADLAGLLKLDSLARARAAALLKKGRGSADLGRGWTLELGAGRARVSRGSEPAELEQPLQLGSSTWGPDWRFELKPGVPDARKLGQDGAFWFAPALLDQTPRLRVAKAGERMQPFGMAGSKLLRDLLAEARVPRWQRAAWPVLEASGLVLALPGVRRSSRLAAEPGKPALCLRWQSLAGQG